MENDVLTTQWITLKPQVPFYLFVPRDLDIAQEYHHGRALREIFSDNSVGIVTARDKLTIQWDRDGVLQTVRNFISLSTEAAREKYELGSDARDWKVEYAQRDLRTTPISNEQVIPILYRPFDLRFTYYTGQSRGFIGQPQQRIMRHMVRRQNLGLSTTRSVEIGRGWEHIFCTSNIVQHHTVSLKEVNYLFPLYLYPTGDAAKQKSLFDVSPWPPGPEGRVPNLNPAFVAEVEQRLGLVFRPHPPAPSPQEGRGSQEQSPPSPLAERGLGGEVSSLPAESGSEGEVSSPLVERPFGSEARWRTPPDLWQKLKPLARQMRREPTPATHKLWQHLRDRQLLGLKFRRQHTIDRFIVDFYCREAQLIIEVDGPIHDYSVEEDAIRQEFLESQGFQVLRFSNQEVLETIGSVLERIAAAVQPHPPAPSPQEGRGSEEQSPPSPLAERGLGGEVSGHSEVRPDGVPHLISGKSSNPWPAKCGANPRPPRTNYGNICGIDNCWVSNSGDSTRLIVSSLIFTAAKLN